MKFTPRVADTAPEERRYTNYDRAHVAIYLRLLDAVTDGADWRDMALIVLGIDPDREQDRAFRAYKAHLERANWLAENCHLILAN